MRFAATLPPVERWLLLGSVLLWVSLELLQSLRRRPEAARVRHGGTLVLRAAYAAGILMGALTAVSAPWAAVRPAWIAGWIGLLLLWAGVGLRAWSFQALGRYFTFTVQTSQDQPVITGGPYRFIRHPGYAGILLALMGLSMVVLANWLSLIAVTMGIGLGLVLRIRVEERALLQDLGDRYHAYAATHKRLVPFVW